MKKIETHTHTLADRKCSLRRGERTTARARKLLLLPPLLIYSKQKLGIFEQLFFLVCLSACVSMRCEERALICLSMRGISMGLCVNAVCGVRVYACEREREREIERHWARNNVFGTMEGNPYQQCLLWRFGERRASRRIKTQRFHFWCCGWATHERTVTDSWAIWASERGGPNAFTHKNRIARVDGYYSILGSCVCVGSLADPRTLMCTNSAR